jgi:hypothetical protein
MAARQPKPESSPVDLIYVEEPHRIQEYARVLDRAAVERQPVVVRRRGIEVAAVISLEHLRVLQDALAYEKAEKLAARIDWSGL